MTLQEAVDFFGSKTEIAKALKINKSAVTNWGNEIPGVRQFQIQVLTNNKLKADQQKKAA